MRCIRILVLLSFAVSPVLGGCSVMMALDGRPATNLEVLEIGASRANIEAALGEPAEQATDTDGATEAVYEVHDAVKPAPIRAVAHGLLDALTLGIWEAVAIPMEMTVDAQGRGTVVVSYDADGVARAIADPARREDDEPPAVEAVTVARFGEEDLPPP